MFLDYDYFCGANVIVSLGDMGVMEAAGVNFSIQESKRPIYGYSSRHFDAVASGQVLVQGSLIINYVHQDYLYRTIQVSKGENVVPRVARAQAIRDFEDEKREVVTEGLLRGDYRLAGNFKPEQELTNALKAAYWDRDSRVFRDRRIGINPHDRFDSCEIRITFGERTVENDFLGDTNLVLTHVHFVGRGVQIQIDENVILEQYSFFARDVESIIPRTLTKEEQPNPTTGEPEEVISTAPAVETNGDLVDRVGRPGFVLDLGETVLLPERYPSQEAQTISARAERAQALREASAQLNESLEWTNK